MMEDVSCVCPSRSGLHTFMTSCSGPTQHSRQRALQNRPALVLPAAQAGRWLLAMAPQAAGKTCCSAVGTGDDAEGGFGDFVQLPTFPMLHIVGLVGQASSRKSIGAPNGRRKRFAKRKRFGRKLGPREGRDRGKQSLLGRSLCGWRPMIGRSAETFPVVC